MISWKKNRGRDDLELEARLLRIGREIVEARRSTEDTEVSQERLKEVERAFSDLRAEKDQAKRLLVIHEIEAMLCMVKSESLLYSTWLRLRENLYRFGIERKVSWQRDMSQMFSNGHVEHDQEIARQKLRQLTLELQESAARYNRLTNEKAEVTAAINRFGIFLILGLLVTLISCYAFIEFHVPAPLISVLTIISCAVSGGMAAVFSRLTTFRRERARYDYELTLKHDMVARACLGAVAAIFIVAALLSGFFRIVVPDDAADHFFLLVLFSFVAGYSDRLFNDTLERVIGSRSPKTSRKSE